MSIPFVNPYPTFVARLAASFNAVQSMLCVGLDPDPERIPSHLGTGPQAIERFCVEIIKATAPFACAFKPQIAYFAAQGAEAALEAIIGHIRELAPHATIVLDAKRGDIGPTAAQYAQEAFVRFGADAVTLSPYMGGDSIAPYHAYPDRGVFVLCRTSNPGGNDLQFIADAQGTPLYQTVARLATTVWNPHQQVGLVVGATYPEELKTVRGLVGDAPLLVPGIGAQGGDIEATVRHGLCSQGWGLLINSSRAILYASAGADFAQAAESTAQATQQAIALARAQVVQS
jgi:orotidine-5'-phosphate decarboxylase